jgi:hypothetical protein
MEIKRDTFKARFRSLFGKSSGSIDVYQYKALCLDDSIRVLELEPAASAQAPIHCNLTEIKLTPDAQYEALSYVWGKDEFPEILNLPDGYLKITENLASALKGLRMTNRSRILWVDAVCINQSDDKEKGSQVARMANVYKSASGVIAWLGDESEDSPMDVEAIIGLSRIAKDLDLGAPVTGQRDILMAKLRDKISGPSALNQILEVGSIAERANFPLIYGNTWFTRMWIVQEALLATHLTLFRGSKSISWKDFEYVMILLHTRREAIRLSVPDVDSFLKHAWNLVEVRSHYHSASERKADERFDFAYYMSQLKRRDCKDARDRLFALRSLLPESSNLVITPDYEKSVVEVFTDLALQQLQHGHIEILYQAGLCRDLTSVFHGLRVLPMSVLRSAPVPSWVPDYRGDVTYVGWKPYFGDDSSFLPDATIEPACTPSPGNPQRLITQSTILDAVIAALPLQFVHDESIRENGPKLFFMLREVLKGLYASFLAEYDSRTYLNDEDPSSAFAHALMGGGTSEEYRKAFRSGVEDEVQPPIQVWQEYEKQCISEEGQLYQEMLLETRSTGPAKRVNGIRQEWYQNTKNSGAAWALTHYLKEVFRYHVFFMTKKGYIGLAPFGTKEDTDLIVFIDGLKVPVVLREVADANWKLVGPCYVHGMMDAEAVRKDERLGARGIFYLI